MSTRAFAMSSINCFITPPPSTWYPMASGSMRIKRRLRSALSFCSLQLRQVFGFLGHRRSNCWIVVNQAFDSLRHPGAILNPMIDAVVFQDDLRRMGKRVVIPHDFESAAIAGAFLLNHHHTIKRLLFGAEPRQ